MPTAQQNNIPMNTGDIIIYPTRDEKNRIELYSQDGNVWLSQKQLAELFATARENISVHTTNILKEKELEEYSASVVTTTKPINRRKWFLPKHKINFFLP